MLFPDFPESSRVWIYGSDRFLTGTEEAYANDMLKRFLDQWAAHGTELFADGCILHHNFIVIVADEAKVKASGCSIDSSVRFVKELGKEINVDFFNRLSVLIEKDGEMKRVPFSELGNYSEWTVFNTTCSTLKELRQGFEIPVAETGWVR